MTRTVVNSKVGADGLLHLTIDLGAAEANRDVRVTVEPASQNAVPAMTQAEWAEFVRRTAGSIADPDFRRHEQGDYEQRAELP